MEEYDYRVSYICILILLLHFELAQILVMDLLQMIKYLCNNIYFCDINEPAFYYKF